MQKRHGHIEREEILRVLDRAVDQEAVIRVRYKDGYSYRNPSRAQAAKGKKKKRGSGGSARYSDQSEGARSSSGSNSPSDLAATRPRILQALSRLAGTVSAEQGVTVLALMADLNSRSQLLKYDEHGLRIALDTEQQRGKQDACARSRTLARLCCDGAFDGRVSATRR